MQPNVFRQGRLVLAAGSGIFGDQIAGHAAGIVPQLGQQAPAQQAQQAPAQQAAQANPLVGALPHAAPDAAPLLQQGAADVQDRVGANGVIAQLHNGVGPQGADAIRNARLGDMAGNRGLGFIGGADTNVFGGADPNVPVGAASGGAGGINGMLTGIEDSVLNAGLTSGLARGAASGGAGIASVGRMASAIGEFVALGQRAAGKDQRTQDMTRNVGGYIGEGLEVGGRTLSAIGNAHMGYSKGVATAHAEFEKNKDKEGAQQKLDDAIKVAKSGLYTSVSQSAALITLTSRAPNIADIGTASMSDADRLNASLVARGGAGDYAKWAYGSSRSFGVKR